MIQTCTYFIQLT